MIHRGNIVSGAVPLYEGKHTALVRGHTAGDGFPVLIKTTRNAPPSEQDRRRIRLEYEIIKSIASNRVIRAVAIRDNDDGISLVLEDFSGTPLKTAIPATGFDTRSFLLLSSNIAAGLADIHKHGVLHLNIKPDTILSSSEKHEIKFIDFSRAEFFPTLPQKAVQPGLSHGTAIYLSPEQTGRIDRPIDFRSDFYSLGVLFYEMLTGAPPFQATEPLEQVY